VGESRLPERLERLGYARVHAEPEKPGEYFYGHEVFWIFRRAHRVAGTDYGASRIGLRLRRSDGMILGAVGKGGATHPLDRAGLLWLEPELLSESLDGSRADRVRVELDDLPEHVWRALLAAEDARFFDHAGVDARAIARAALANVKKGGVAQGGSTITQQLIKNRDLTPKRSFGRKASEAARALILEAEYDKREILEAYLNQVYYGHVDGLAVHGIGAAARVYFSKSAARLDLAESATLAAMVQGPNRLSPLTHPDRARVRRDWVLSRLDELDWATPDDLRRARQSDVITRRSAPLHAVPTHFLSWVSEAAKEVAGERLAHGRGVVVETSIDPLLQAIAERAVRDQLARIRRRSPRLRGRDLTAALVAIDLADGGILAYVGGDPGDDSDRFDRARRAKRQPGSAVKPFVMLEALDSCGSRDPLTVATRVADESLRIDLPSGGWQVDNFDRKYRGVVDLRTVLVRSLNVPTVRISRWCGFEATASMFRRVGLDLPESPPPSFVLGSVETTPLRLATAYTAIAMSGIRLDPRPVLRIEKPEGKAIAVEKARRAKVVRPASAWLVGDLMRSAVSSGTAKIGSLEGADAAAKTGSSSDLRDAWFAGYAGSVVTVVWVGLDDGTPLGLTGSVAAGPIWRAFMQTAVPARPTHRVEMPRRVVRRYVDSRTGLLVRESNRRARSEVFHKKALPRRDRFWRVDPSAPVLR